MTLLQMSPQYADSAALIHARIQELKEEVRKHPDDAFPLLARIEMLKPMLRESRELAILTARYYDRSYHKHEEYTL